MKAVVLGAGIVGVATAYELQRDGCEVVVVDRHDAPAMETSYANAGLIAPGHAYAWASPAAPRVLLRSLLRDDQALRFRPQPSLAYWRWAARFLANCTAERAHLNTRRKLALCRYSQACLEETAAAAKLDYDGQDGGLLYFYRTPASFENGRAKAELLRGEGMPIEVLDADAVVAKDPGLAAASKDIAGALFVASDASGDARKFTQGLATLCEARGAAFHWGTAVTGFETDGGRVRTVTTDTGSVSGDLFVLATGVRAPVLARQAGVNLPIYPVKGYSVTLSVADRDGAPRLGGVDEDNLVAYCPMGDRLRITATAEIGGYSVEHRPSDFRHMLAVAQRLFPTAADFSAPDYWAGLRPMTPEGTPIFGRGRLDNLWFNTGQGHMGWTMASGSARIVADLVAGREPAIDLAGMLLQ